MRSGPALALVASMTHGACTADENDQSGDTVPSDAPDDGGACATEPMALTPGTGAEGFLPLADGDSVEIVHGPQGGWHIETGGEVDHSGEEVRVMASVTVISDGLQIAGADQDIVLYLASYDDDACSDRGAGHFFGIRTFVDDVAQPPGGMSYQDFICSLEGEEVELSVTVEDLDNDRSVTASVVLFVQLDSLDASICH